MKIKENKWKKIKKEIKANLLKRTDSYFERLSGDIDQLIRKVESVYAYDKVKEKTDKEYMHYINRQNRESKISNK